MRDIKHFHAAAIMLNTSASAILIVQANIAWSAFMDEPSVENAGKVVDYLEAFKSVAAPEPVKRRRKTAAAPATEPTAGQTVSADGYGEAGTVDQTVATAQRRRRKAVAPGEPSAGAQVPTGSSETPAAGDAPVVRRRRRSRLEMGV